MILRIILMRFYLSGSHVIVEVILQEVHSPPIAMEL